MSAGVQKDAVRFQGEQATGGVAGGSDPCHWGFHLKL